MQRRHLLGLALAAAAPVRAQSGYDVTPWPAGRAAPPLQALDMQGKTWTLAALRGRVVVLNFWATWCPPCRAEMPSLQQLAEIYGPGQLQVLAVNVGEGPRRIAQYLQSSGLDLTVLLDPQSQTARAWGATALPTTYLIDAEGRPRQRVLGEVDWTGREAASWIEPLLRDGSRRAT
jgi:thiol-disulfide isomerase/thioredoxin